MAIVKLTEEQIAHLKVGCPTLAKFELGNLINDIIDGVEGEVEEPATITEEDEEKLNNMCVFNGLRLGSTLKSIIDANGEVGGTLEAISGKEVAALNHTCGTLDGVEIGTKLNEIIEAINQKNTPKEDPEPNLEEGGKE